MRHHLAHSSTKVTWVNYYSCAERCYMTAAQAAPGNKLGQRISRTHYGSNLALVPFHVSCIYLKTTQLSKQQPSYLNKLQDRGQPEPTHSVHRDYDRLRTVITDLQLSMLSKNQPLMGTDIKKPKSCTPRRNFRLPTYLRKPPRAALKIKSRNGEVSLQIESKMLRLRRLVLAPAIHRKTWTVQLLPGKAI